MKSRAPICKHLRRPDIVFEASIPPAWRAGTTNMAIVPGRQDTQDGGIDSLESIPGLLNVHKYGLRVRSLIHERGCVIRLQSWRISFTVLRSCFVIFQAINYSNNHKENDGSPIGYWLCFAKTNKSDDKCCNINFCPTRVLHRFSWNPYV